MHDVYVAYSRPCDTADHQPCLSFVVQSWPSDGLIDLGRWRTFCQLLVRVRVIFATIFLTALIRRSRIQRHFASANMVCHSQLE